MEPSEPVGGAALPEPRIVSTPGVAGGKPRIAGHRIKVQDVAVWHERLAMTPDEIVNAYPTLTLSDVHYALGYYLDNRDQIDADLREDERFIEAYRDGAPSVMEKVRRWSAHVADDPIPPG